MRDAAITFSGDRADLQAIDGLSLPENLPVPVSEKQVTEERHDVPPLLHDFRREVPALAVSM